MHAARPLIVLGSAALVLLTAVGLSEAANNPRTPSPATPKPKSLTVTAPAVTGLVPTTSLAQASTVMITITSDSGAASTLSKVTGQARMPAGSRCSASDVEVVGYDAATPGAASYQLPGKGSVIVPVKVRLRNTSVNQDACKRANLPGGFTIAYSVTTSGK